MNDKSLDIGLFIIGLAASNYLEPGNFWSETLGSEYIFFEFR